MSYIVFAPETILESLKRAENPNFEAVLSEKLNQITFARRSQNEQIEVLQTILSPDQGYDWADLSRVFFANYELEEPDNEGYYRWGQIVPEDADYLCRDCGYVENLKAGSTFPVCEACLDGMPDGVCGPEEGFWEKL